MICRRMLRKNDAKQLQKRCTYKSVRYSKKKRKEKGRCELKLKGGKRIGYVRRKSISLRHKR